MLGWGQVISFPLLPSPSIRTLNTTIYFTDCGELLGRKPMFYASVIIFLLGRALCRDAQRTLSVTCWRIIGIAMMWLL